MRAVPVNDLTSFTNLWVNQPWPLSKKEAEDVCRSLGWEQDEEGFFLLPYGPSDAYLTIVVGQAEFGVSTMHTRVVESTMTESAERDAFMNDAFVAYVAALVTDWGKPRMKRSKKDQEATWDLPNGAMLKLSNVWRTVLWLLHPPAHAEVERYLRGRR